MTITIDGTVIDENGVSSTPVLDENQKNGLIERLSNLKWWDMDGRDNSQFTGVENFYGFDEDGKAGFLEDGDASRFYLYKLNLDKSGAFINKYSGARWQVKFDNENDYEEFTNKVLWNRTFYFSRGEAEPKMRVFNVVYDKDGFEERKQEITDLGAERLVELISENHWNSQPLPGEPHRYFGFTDAGKERVLKDYEVCKHFVHHLTIDESKHEACLKDFLSTEYLFTFSDEAALNGFIAKVVMPKLFVLVDDYKAPGAGEATEQKIVQKAVHAPKTPIEKLAKEFERHNYIHEIEVLVSCANSMETASRHKASPDREAAWATMDMMLDDAKRRLTQLRDSRPELQ